MLGSIKNVQNKYSKCFFFFKTGCKDGANGHDKSLCRKIDRLLLTMESDLYHFYYASSTYGHCTFFYYDLLHIFLQHVILEQGRLMLYQETFGS